MERKALEKGESRGRERWRRRRIGRVIYSGDILLHMFHLRVCLRNLQSHKTANKVANIMVETGRGQWTGEGATLPEKWQKRKRQKTVGFKGRASKGLGEATSNECEDKTLKSQQ